jgi:formiminotetrahydrofolate cyclodeaminase
MRDDTVEAFLQALSERVPAPGGGATAALHAGQAAALVAMVARYSNSAAFAEHAETIDAVLAAADSLRHDALALAEEDMSAFTAVTDAYRMPKTTENEVAARKSAIADALAGAARVPARVLDVADRVVELAEIVLPVGNRNVISDVAAAAEAARAAATTARVNIEINLGGIKDSRVRGTFLDVIGAVDDIVARAEKVTTTVREVVAA